MKRNLLSFVVPAFNEEKLIGTTLAAIGSAVGDNYEYEIVVVDNGSTDDTVGVATRVGVRIVSQPGGTVASLRNEGARNTTGEYLVFLDADVVIAADWGRQVGAILEVLKSDSRTLTGGMCVVPDGASWIERIWFEPREPDSMPHIGSGHLIVTRSFFEEIGGFDESLETGEDYDLSRRAVAAGGRIAPEPALVAEHRGFPTTLREFFRREVWHGRGDLTSIKAVLGSKVAVAALLFGLAHAVLLAGMLFANLKMTVVGAGSIVGICLASSWIRYRKRSRILGLANAGLFYVYFAARLLSFVSGGKYRGRVAERK